jgi:hypothetical protein
MHDGDELNHDDLDDDALDAVRRAFSDLHAPGPPPLEAIAAKAQALRRRRRRRRSGLAAAVSAAAAVAITAAVLAAPGHPATTHLGSGPVHVNLADFSVDSNADGTVRLDLRAKQAPDAPQLASVLAQAGVPAVVRVGAFCGATISPSGLHQAIINVVAINHVADSSSSAGLQVPAKGGGGGFLIRPSAIPKNAELSIGYSSGQVTLGLVAANRPLTCVVDRAVKCAELPAAGAAGTTLPARTGTIPPAASTLPVAAATTLPAAATTLPVAAGTVAPAATTTTSPPAATTLVPVGSPAHRPTPAAGRGGVFWCEVQVLAPPAYAATTTSTPVAATTTTPSSGPTG